MLVDRRKWRMMRVEILAICVLSNNSKKQMTILLSLPIQKSGFITQHANLRGG